MRWNNSLTGASVLEQLVDNGIIPIQLIELVGQKSPIVNVSGLTNKFKIQLLTTFRNHEISQTYRLLM